MVKQTVKRLASARPPRRVCDPLSRISDLRRGKVAEAISLFRFVILLRRALQLYRTGFLQAEETQAVVQS